MTRITDLILFVIVCVGLVMVATTVIRAGARFVEGRNIDVPAMMAKYKAVQAAPAQHPRIATQAMVK